MDGSDQVMYKQVSSWDTDDVVAWIRGLDERLASHVPHFEAHCICGTDLLKLSRQQLEYLKVSQVGHQELVMEAIELLLTLENGRTRNSTIVLASNLSKKTSQLVNTLSHPPSKKPSLSDDSETAENLGLMETTAAVMLAGKSLVNWLDRNPSSLVSDYETFRQQLLKSALDLSSILQNSYDTAQMTESCRSILKLTSVMMSPQNFSVVEPINLTTAILKPKEDTGLGFSIQRTRQGNLLISNVMDGSPAAECGKVHAGDEIVQINLQNVVGWEISKVVQTLKASGHVVTLVLKAGRRWCESGDETTDESCDSRDQLTDDLTDSHGSLNDYDKLGSASQDEDDGDDGAPPIVIKLQRDSSFDVKRTISTPLTDQEKAVALEKSPSHEKTLSELEEDTDGAPSEGSGRLESFEERLSRRTSSEGGAKRNKKDDVQVQYPAVAYRTQVVGGVVMRIPIKNPEESVPTKPKKEKKHGKGKKRHGHGSFTKTSTVPEPSTPVEDAPVEKGKAIFSDPREVTIGGQAIKQVTVSTSSEPSLSKEEARKKANPALMVPCFQLKDVDHEGWMNKLGGSGLTPKNWRRRWFVLKNKQLFYYKTSFDISALGIVGLVGYTIETAPEMKKKSVIKATRTGARTYYFQPDTAEEMMRWMQMLKEACEPGNELGPEPVATSIDQDDKSDDEL